MQEINKARPHQLNTYAKFKHPDHSSKTLSDIGENPEGQLPNNRSSDPRRTN